MKKHYVYRIDRISTGEYYIGKGSCSQYKDPAKDNYMGSGVLLRDKMSIDPADWVKSILYVADSEEEAYATEARLLGDRWHTDEQCLNLVEGGSYSTAKMATCAAIGWSDAKKQEHSDKLREWWADPEYREKMSTMVKALWQDPDYIEMQREQGRQHWLNKTDIEKATWAKAQSERISLLNKDPEFIAVRDQALREGNARLWAERREEMKATFKKRKCVKLLSPDGSFIKVAAEQVACSLSQGYTLTSKLITLSLPDQTIYATLNITGDNQRRLVHSWLIDGKVLFGVCGNATKKSSKEFKACIISYRS